MEEFLLDDLADPARAEAFAAWAAGRKRAGDRRVTVRIRGASDELAPAWAWHARLASCDPLPVATVLEGAVWVPQYLVWLAGVALACEADATVWFGGLAGHKYTAEWHDLRDRVASRVLRTNYQENRGYPLRTAIDLLGGTEIVGPKRLAELHGASILPGRGLAKECPPLPEP